MKNMNSTDIARNPDKLAPGDRCFGVCLESFKPDAGASIIPGSRGIITGRAMADYACKPLDGDGPAVYFLPDEVLENTHADSPFYSLQNWAVFRARTKAMAARAALANAAITAYKLDMAELAQYI